MFNRYFFYGASRIVVVGGQLLLIPVAVTQLGVSGYGIYNLILQGAMLVRLLSLQAVAQTVNREYVQLAKTYGEVEIYFSGLTFVFLALTVVILLTILFGPAAADVFHLTTAQVWLALAMGAAFVFFGYKHLILYSTNFTAYGIWDTVQPFAISIAPLLIGLIIPSVEAYSVGCIAFTLICALVMFRKPMYLPSLKTLAAFGHAVRMFGLPLVFGELFGWIIAVADRFQIASMLGTEQAGIYTAAYQLFVPPIALIGVATVLQPTAFSSSDDGYRARMNQAAAFTLLISIGYLVATLGLGKEIFALFFRNKAEIDISLIIVLVLTGIVSAFYYLELISGKYVRNVRAILVAQFIAALVVLAGNFLLLPYLGIMAAAATSLVAYIVQVLVLRSSTGEQYRFSYLDWKAVREMLVSLYTHLLKLKKRFNAGKS